MVEKAVPQLWTDLSVGCWFEVEVWLDCFWIAVACLTYVTGWACIRSCDSKEQETLKWGDTRKRCVTCQWESYIWVELQQLWCPGVSIVVSEGWVCLIKVVLQTTPEQPLAFTDDLIKIVQLGEHLTISSLYLLCWKASVLECCLLSQ